MAGALLLGGVVDAQESAASFFDQEHKVWNALLQEHVHEGGLVDYVGLGRKRSQFDLYISSLEGVTAKEFRTWKAPEREAFWINAYNAYAIQLVLDNYPVDSIKDMGGLFSSVFDKRYIPLQHLVVVDPRAKASRSKALTLGEVEHEILFPISQKPLFHFAIVCASTSCPVLLDEAYTAAKLEEQIEQQTRMFLADSSRNNGSISSGKLGISKIFEWAEDELDTYPGGIRKLLLDFGPPSLVKDKALSKAKLKYRDYDWSLNQWLPPKD
ncbi:MAG: DUF547 domain-containing protein [Planctomycetota bacterium]|nr:DUF547 domain-containing protein [Planctomycetota bacterium]MDA1114317.1 DUF547 domain-containing protein [Planctomycetota bacterium]